MALVLVKNLSICFSWFWASRIYFPASLRSRRVWFPPVNTTMKALNPQLSASQVCGTAEVSLLISIELPNIPSPTTLLPFRSPQFDTLPGSVTVRAVSPTVRSHRTDFPVIFGPMREIRGSRVARTLPDRLGRIEFTFVTDCSFAFGCSPPFLLKTQLPSATRR